MKIERGSLIELAAMANVSALRDQYPAEFSRFAKAVAEYAIARDRRAIAGRSQAVAGMGKTKPPPPKAGGFTPA